MMEMLQTGVVDKVAQKAAHIAEIDPDGLTLTLVAVMVVFGVLLILYVIYALVGEVFMAIYRKRDRKAAEEAAAIGIALEQYLGGDAVSEGTAVAVALDRFISDEEIHDRESGIITIRR